jgi:hypothetical protein
LIAVCIAHALSPLLLLGPHVPLGWDETVYVSQIDPHHIAAYFSAPRARGVTLLTAPISLVTPSLAALRVWLACLSGVGLYAGMRPWLRLVQPWTVPFAAALWSGLWVSVFYGYAAMPNQWVAFAAVAATGWCVVALRDPTRRWAWIWLGVALAVAALMRPSDSVAIAAPLVIAIMAARRVPLRRRIRLLSAIAAGLGAGWVEWIMEAQIRFGGIASRLHAASVENGGGGLHWALGAEMRALAGPTLCRYHCHADAATSDRLWWFLLLPLAVAGIVLARRRSVLIWDALPLVLPMAVGIALAIEYFVVVGYAAPRFLMPAYLLLAIPVADALRGGYVALPARGRTAAAAVLAAALALQTFGQVDVARRIGSTAKQAGSLESSLARFLSARGVSGVRADGRCAVAGNEAGPTSYDVDCYGIDTIGWRQIAQELAQDHGDRVALVLPPRESPLPFYATWPYAMFVDGRVRWKVWLSPEADRRAT